MTAQVPRERRIGAIAFAQSNFGPDLISPNFPLLNYEWLVLRCSGTMTISDATGAVINPENPWSIVKGVQCVVTGLTGDTFIDLPMNELRVLTHYVGRRPGRAPLNTPTGITAAAHPFSFEIYLPFSLEDMSNPYRGFFASNRYAQVRLRILWGQATDLVSGTGAFANTVAATTQIEVFGREYSFDPRFELANDLLLHQRVNIKEVSINNVAQTNFDIEIPRTASFLRGILVKQYDFGAVGTATIERPIATLITLEQQVTLLYNDTDRKYEYKFSQVQNQNTEAYRLPLPTGYFFVDLAPGVGADGQGDFSLLQNMLNLQKIVLRVDNNAVANAFLRLTLVKYALSA